MNRHTVCATFVAAIGATIALASTGAVAGKPAPQPPPNSCIGAQSRGFPAVVFTRKRVTGGHVYYDTILADAPGQCQQTVFVADGFVPGPGSDVNLRYDATTRAGLIVRSAPGGTIVASRFAVSFNASGVPAVQSSNYSTILTLANLTVPADLAAEGWSKYVLGDPLIAPDGKTMLALVFFQQIQGSVQTMLSTYWTCPFDASQLAVNSAGCQMVYRFTPRNLSASAGWGAGSDSIWITDTSVSGSGSGVYRLELATKTLTQIWSQGTLLDEAKGSLDTITGHERVAVLEQGQSSNCNRVLVIDANSCVNNFCQVLNGAGSPARNASWLPDGRVAGDGQTAPNGKGQCSESGSVVVFDPADLTGSAATISASGNYPDGANGG